MYSRQPQAMSSCLSKSLIAVIFATLAASAGDCAKPAKPRGQTKIQQSTVDEFAPTVIQATKLISYSHIKKVNQADLIDWAVRGLYRGLNEKIPKGIAMRLPKIKDMNEGDRKRVLQEARSFLGKRKNLEHWKDIDLALEGIFSRLEPDMKVMPQEEARREKMYPEYFPVGIGLRIGIDASTGTVQVVTPIKDGPAYKVGLRAGDTILKISWEVADAHTGATRPAVVSTKGLSLEKINDKIFGQPRTKIKLTFRRVGAPKLMEATVTRKDAKEETVLGFVRMGDHTWNYQLDSDKKIAYIRLTRFSRDTDGDLAQTVTGLEKQGIRGLVLDLRFSPGGLVRTGTKSANLFIQSGLLMSIRSRKEKWLYKVEKPGGHLKLPMACLINGTTAKMSEVIAACLQDHKRAVVLGERSAGNTGVFEVLHVGDGGLITYTTALMCRPNGKNLSKLMTSGKEEDEWGVIPDKGFVLKLAPHERQALFQHQENLERIWPRDRVVKQKKPQFKDRQLEMALAYLRRKIK